MPQKYSEQDMARAILLVLDQSLPIKKVAREMGINLRALQRYKARYLADPTTTTLRQMFPTVRENPLKEDEPIVKKDNPVASAEVMDATDKTLIARAKFLDDVLSTKQVLLDRLKMAGGKSNNIDALHKAIKTLDDLETKVVPEGGNSPAAQVKTLNVFQLFNQQLINEGYEGPEIPDADIVKND
jgi:transposase-like protein